MMWPVWAESMPVDVMLFSFWARNYVACWLAMWAVRSAFKIGLAKWYYGLLNGPAKRLVAWPVIFMVDTSIALTVESSTKQKAANKKWERSNRISLMIMKGSITTAIRGAIPDSNNAKLYLAHIEEQFQGSSKAHATTLITKMVTLKYSGSNGVREHILRINVMASLLKGLDMKISEEEERLKSEQPDSAHVAITGLSKGKGKGKKFGKSNVQRNKSASVTKTDKASSSGTKGATVHITNSLQGFLSVKKLNKGKRNVLVGNGEKAQVEVVGTLRLVLESGFNLDLIDIVYVPSMTRNLISVSRLDVYGYSFKFENKGFSLFLYSRVIDSGLLEGNLYKLLLNASFTESLKTMNVNDVVAKICGAPQQNRVAERQNRTLMDMVRSMICQSILPEFCGLKHLKQLCIFLTGFPAAVFFSKNNKSSGGMKHIEIKYLVVRERIQNQIVSIQHISTIAMLAIP
ncbi:hypothetical protein RJ639_020226 [Escallonia herrerae]|uniref:Retrovirus-related Pol polyprotein from transposon TNT 1-94-like beta-barrel domain-containing protein n=1 Tax=Escallonia herrerae TaxID=1293975 RepID=A0AA88V8I3_9ASTE|nr:hypothetical protein RJ639_020226 [Escallonia herrerae]